MLLILIAQINKNQIDKYEISLYLCEFQFLVFEYSIILFLQCNLEQTIWTSFSYRDSSYCTKLKNPTRQNWNKMIFVIEIAFSLWIFILSNRIFHYCRFLKEFWSKYIYFICMQRFIILHKFNITKYPKFKFWTCKIEISLYVCEFSSWALECFIILSTAYDGDYKIFSSFSPSSSSFQTNV